MCSPNLSLLFVTGHHRSDGHCSTTSAHLKNLTEPLFFIISFNFTDLRPVCDRLLSSILMTR